LSEKPGLSLVFVLVVAVALIVLVVLVVAIVLVVVAVVLVIAVVVIAVFLVVAVVRHFFNPPFGLRLLFLLLGNIYVEIVGR
jgi:hypothetical protein